LLWFGSGSTYWIILYLSFLRLFTRASFGFPIQRAARGALVRFWSVRYAFPRITERRWLVTSTCGADCGCRWIACACRVITAAPYRARSCCRTCDVSLPAAVMPLALPWYHLFTRGQTGLCRAATAFSNQFTAPRAADTCLGAAPANCLLCCRSCGSGFSAVTVHRGSFTTVLLFCLGYTRARLHAPRAVPCRVHSFLRDQQHIAAFP
jgi:hypothetical protein